MTPSGTDVASPATLIRLPLYDPEIMAVEDTQHRPIPSSVEELLELRKEEPSQDDKIYKDPKIAIEEISVLGADGPLHAIVLTRKSRLATSNPGPGVLFFHGGGRATGKCLCWSCRSERAR